MRNVILTLAALAAVVAGCDEDSEPADDAASGGNAGNGGVYSGGTAAGSAGSESTAGSGGAEAQGGGEASGASGGSGDAAWKLRAMTYNTALAPGFEPLSAERSPLLVSALAAAAQELDLLCVQELWQTIDWDALKVAARSELPSRVYQQPKPGSGDCTPAELGALDACLTDNCAGQEGDALVLCASQNCSEVIASLSGGCMGCIMNHVSDGSFLACLGDGSALQDPAIFAGDYDVALLSRYAIEEQAVEILDAYMVRAAALYARVNVPGLGPVDAFCTHLGSSLGVIPYKGPYGSWDGEHAHQVEQLVDFVAEKNDGQRPLLLLGDLNMGPALAGPPSVKAVLADDYQLLLDAGFENQFVSSPVATCTFCGYSKFADPPSSNQLIDHVLSKNFSAPSVTFTRELATPVVVLEGEDPVDLSDHYALRLELARP